MESGVMLPTCSVEVSWALPVELEEVLGSSEEGEGVVEEEVEGGDTDRSSGDRTPWLSSSS